MSLICTEEQSEAVADQANVSNAKQEDHRGTLSEHLFDETISEIKPLKIEEIKRNISTDVPLSCILQLNEAWLMKFQYRFRDKVYSICYWIKKPSSSVDASFTRLSQIFALDRTTYA